MTDTALEPRAHARIAYLGPVSPHWEVYGDYGDRTLLDLYLREQSTLKAETDRIEALTAVHVAEALLRATIGLP